MAENLSILTPKLRRALAQLPYLPRALTLVWTAARRWTMAWLALLLVQGLLPAATVFLTKLLVDSLVPAVGRGFDGQHLRPVLVWGALMAGVMLLAEVLHSVTNLVRAAQSDLVQDHISGLIHKQSIAVDLAFYESPDYFDRLHRARGEASYRPVLLLESLGGLLQNAVTLIAMAAVLLPFGVWLPVALLVSALPAFYVVLRFTLRQHEWRLRTTADERRALYYDWLLTDGGTAAELRLFALGEHFKIAYQRLRLRLRRERLQLAKDQSRAELAASLMALLVSGGALAWTVWRFLRGSVTLGDLALFYQALNQGQRLMRSALENAGQIYANSLFLSNLFEFLALKPLVTDAAETVPAPPGLREGVRFRDVTFRYPGSQCSALRKFNLSIGAGQIAAVVGFNGAGKSTLIKLLCRLYDPDAGRIEMDGIDLRDVSINELRRMITILFQEPVRYSASVAENVALGDLEAADDLGRIKAAAEAAGADRSIGRLPDGYDNLLGKWFEGGAELSVGEWQRLALARAYVRQSPIIILDEPTSAMDPWAEADWLERFRHLAAGRTVILITHRLTTAMHADVIHVMADGQIVESGRHDELISSDGLYAQSWVSQMGSEAALAGAG